MELAGSKRCPEPGASCLCNAFVVRITITLDDVVPTVSRMIEVPLDIRLDRLHTVFHAALAWTDSHLWELTFGRTGFGIPDPGYGFSGPLDARKTTLAQALEGMRDKTFRYLYDFGDAWEHSIKIHGIAPADPHSSYPRLIEATGMRPPEDSGGPCGYAEKLEALADPTHEYHEEALDALGDDHDLKAQTDIDMIHTRFAALAKKLAPRTGKVK